jgi:hypothetical protein
VTNCNDFSDAGSVVAMSPLDGVHLDPRRHMLLGERLSEVAHALRSTRS